MIRLEEFANEVVTALEKFPVFSNAEFQVSQVAKPAGILTGITIHFKNNPVAPVYYINEAVERNISAWQMASDIAERISNDMAETPNQIRLQYITDWSISRLRIVPRLINKDWNKEYLKNRVVTELAGDICVIYDIQLPVQKEGSSMTVPVTKELMGIWLTDIPTIHKAALQNGTRLRPAKIASLASLLGMPFDPDGFPDMTVLTCEEGSFGAACILYPETHDTLKEIFKNGYWLLPSSIFEWICVAREMGDPEELQMMVASINAEEVAPEDRLSDSVYELRDGKLCCAMEGGRC